MATRSTTIRIRLSPELKSLARQRASKAETTVSDMLRRMIKAGAPMNPATAPEKKSDESPSARAARTRCDGDGDDPVRAELRRLGGLLKHLYPGDKPWASPVDKRRWWQALENIEAMGRGRVPPHVIESLPPER